MPTGAPVSPAIHVTGAGKLQRCRDHCPTCDDATKQADVQSALGTKRLADMAFAHPADNVAQQGSSVAKMTIPSDALSKDFLDVLRLALANLLPVARNICYLCLSSFE